MLHIVNSYGYWRDDASAERKPSSTNVRPVRVSSDSLLRRPSPQNSFRQAGRAPGLQDTFRSQAKKDKDNRNGTDKWRDASGNSSGAGVELHGSSPAVDGTRAGPPSINVMLNPIDESVSQDNTSSSHGARVVQAARMKSAEQVQDALHGDHYRAHVKHMCDHYVICAGQLSEALSLVKFLRCYYQFEHQTRYRNQALAGSMLRSHLSVRLSSCCFVLLVDSLPDAQRIIDVIEERDNGDDDEHLFQNVYFVAGSPSKSKDLVRAGAPRARHVVILPFDEQASVHNGIRPSAHLSSTSESNDQHDDESLADFGVLSSLLAVEITRQYHAHLLTNSKRSPVSPRRRRMSRALSVELGAPGVEAMPPTYQREVDQGLPVESVKLRMLERFPDLDPTVFREKGGVIEARLHQHDAEQQVQRHSQTEHATTAKPLLAENALGVLHYTKNARFCRPRDHEVCHDEFPYLAPSFASGNVFLSSVLDRIVCQGFYNPYITDVVESLASGSAFILPSSSTSNDFRVDGAASIGMRQSSGSTWSHSRFAAEGDSHHRRLFRVDVEVSHIGEKFLDVFLEYLSLEMLVVGILRSPNPVLENLLPFVYTCPDPETVLHDKDRLFVIG